jgi:hypothetical protein
VQPAGHDTSDSIEAVNYDGVVADHFERSVGDSVGGTDSVSLATSFVRHVHDEAQADDSAESVLLRLGPAAAHSGAALKLTVNGSDANLLPERVDLELTKSQWNMACAGFGLTFGGAFFHAIGAAIGGTVFFIWGRWRWGQSQTRRR